MKVISLILFFGLIIAQATSKEEAAVDDPCAESIIDDCIHTEYEAYKKCIEEVKSKRIKRQAQCPYVVNAPQPVQNIAYYPVQQQQQIIQSPAIIPCNTVSCVPQVAPVHFVPIENIINKEVDVITENHVEYQSQPTGERRIIVTTNDNNVPMKYSNSLPVPGHNITTVINLNNMINNTNIIDSPTNINNTNINNIHIYHNKTSTTGGKFGLGYTEKGSCCFAVRPKTCRKTSNGPKCHHHRHKMCGTQCTSRIMHTQMRRKCSSRGGCNRRTVHIPQPSPPRCISTYYWPYTSCGGYQRSSCEGCYDHYGYGYENYYGGYESGSCNGCYDDGYDHGPLYRRGPVLRPTHYHEPPCELTGSCEDNYYSTSNGYFGHDRIDPAFHEDDSVFFDGDRRDFERIFNITAIDEDGGDDEESGDYAVVSRKCVAEESDGSIIIRNCTMEDLENQYAGSPLSNVLHSDQTDRRRTRQSSAPFYDYPPQPPQMYYPPPPPYMSPYIMAPPPIQYMPPPQQFIPRRPNYYENDDSEDSFYNDDDYESEVEYRPRTKAHVKKHDKVVKNRFPIDEEDLDSFKDDDRAFDVYSPDD